MNLPTKPELRQIIDPRSHYPWVSAEHRDIRGPKGKRWHRRTRRSLRQAIRNWTPRLRLAPSPVVPGGSRSWR